MDTQFEVQVSGTVDDAKTEVLLHGLSSTVAHIGTLGVLDSFEVRFGISREAELQPASIMIRERELTKEGKAGLLTKFGEIIRESRLDQRKSTRKLAKEVGVSASYISILERGINPQTGSPANPTFDVLLRVCSVLQLDILVVLDKLGYKITQQPVETK